MVHYTDYDINNLVLINETENTDHFKWDDWSAEDKQTFIIEYCPSTEKMINELENFIAAVKDGIIKQNTYYGVNKVSAKAWVKNCEYIRYGEMSGRYTSLDDKEIYIKIDSLSYRIRDSYDAKNILAQLNNTERRFHNILVGLWKKEKDLREKLELENYKDINADRIIAGKKAYEIYRAFDRCHAPYGIKEDRRWDDSIDYEALTTGVYGTWTSQFNISRNKYGELTYNKEIISAEKANEFLNICLEYGRKMSGMIDEFNRVTKSFMEGDG